VIYTTEIMNFFTKE